MQSPRERLEALRRSGAVRLVGDPERVVSYSNDTWLAQTADGVEAVLRVCWIGDRKRLLREAAVGAALPPEVGYPQVLDSGRWTVADGAITWMLSRRLTGCTLMEAWSTLDERTRERAVLEVAEPLRALHTWRPETELAARIASTARLQTATSDDIIGASILPLPLERLQALVSPAAERAGAYAPVVDAAWRWLVDHADLLPALDDPATGVVTHGDLHLGNVWGDGARVTGLIDVEWVRWGPAWLDLARIRDHAVLAGSGGEDEESNQAHARLLAALRSRWPELEVVPELDRRLTAAQLTHQLRSVLTWGPPGDHPAVDHPVSVLRLLLDLIG